MEQLHIVREPAGLIRKIARDALKNHWKDVSIAVGIYMLLTTYISEILNQLFPMYRDIPIDPDLAQIYGQILELDGNAIKVNASFIGDLYQFLLTGAFAYGLALMLLTFFRTKRTDNKLLFEGFSLFGKTILLQILITVFTILWALLFVIPGIVAAYRYSQAFFILADHPEYSVTQCINESKARMRGNKGALFVLDLTFIGWGILASMASNLIVTGLPSGNVASLIAAIISLIPMILYNTYFQVGRTVFYELLTQNLVVMVPDQHIQEQGVNPGNMVNASYEVHETPVMKDADIQAEAMETQAEPETVYEAAPEFTAEPEVQPEPEVEIKVDPEDVIEPEVIIMGGPVEEAPFEEGPEIIVEEAEPEIIIEETSADEGPEIVIEDEADAFGAPKDEKDEL